MSYGTKHKFFEYKDLPEISIEEFWTLIKNKDMKHAILVIAGQTLESVVQEFLNQHGYKWLSGESVFSPDIEPDTNYYIVVNHRQKQLTWTAFKKDAMKVAGARSVSSARSVSFKELKQYVMDKEQNQKQVYQIKDKSDEIKRAVRSVLSNKFEINKYRDKLTDKYFVDDQQIIDYLDRLGLLDLWFERVQKYHVFWTESGLQINVDPIGQKVRTVHGSLEASQVKELYERYYGRNNIFGFEVKCNAIIEISCEHITKALLEDIINTLNNE